MDDDEVPRLSESTLAALQEFLQEQATQNESDIKENWQLSQFWYDEGTIEHLSRAGLIQCCSDDSKIALISSPSLYKQIKSLSETGNGRIEVKLFEYDERFSCFAPDFVFYDYNDPLSLENSYRNYFDVVLIDPPFLSEECLSKTTETVKFLCKEGSKIILCTGAVMEDAAGRLLNVKKCSFQPKHKNNLANDFICLSNFGELLRQIIGNLSSGCIFFFNFNLKSSQTMCITITSARLWGIIAPMFVLHVVKFFSLDGLPVCCHVTTTTTTIAQT